MTIEFNQSELRVEAVDIDLLQEAPNNNKIHTQESTRRLAKSLADVGQIQPVIVDKDYEIIAGHGRRLAAKALGWAKIKIIRVPVAASVARKMRLADNLMTNGNFNNKAIEDELRQMFGDGEITASDLDGLISEPKLEAIFKTSLDEAGNMNLDALSTNVQEDVQNFGEENDAMMKAADNADTQLRQVFGFSTLTPAQARLVKRFLAQVIEETKVEDPRDAFIAWIEELVA